MLLLPTLQSLALIAITLGIASTDAQDGSTSSVSTTDVTPSNLPSNAITTSLNATNSTVPRGAKTYVTSLRVTAAKTNFCAATLTSPSHVLTAAGCVVGDIRWASVGSHYNNGTEDGEQIKVVAILNHPNNSDYSYDFSVLQLERPTSVKPVALAAFDGSDVKDGEWVTKFGWYNTGGEGQRAHELQRADVQLISNDKCNKQTTVDDSMLCSRAVDNELSCRGNYGGPVIVEGPHGDVMVGVISSSSDCRKEGYPSMYARVSAARDWIESVASGVCFH